MRTKLETLKKYETEGKKNTNLPLQRIEMLLDKNSFVEIDKFVKHRCKKLRDKKLPRDGVICGHGKINKRPVVLYSQDFAVLGGSLGEGHAKKICKVQNLAQKFKIPIIGIIESGGARIQEGINSLDGYSNIIYNNCILSGLVPQISIVVGPSAGGASYSAGLTDFIFMIEDKSRMFITGSKVIKALTGEEITDTELGGSRIHSEISGVSHFVTKNEEDCMNKVRKLLDYLPSNCFEFYPQKHNSLDSSRKIFFKNNNEFVAENILGEEILNIIPDNPKKGFDIRDIIRLVIDEGDFFEIHKDFAKNIVTAFSRINGIPIGIIANQSIELAGAIDTNGSIKAARFIRFCDSFNTPILTFVDNPGFWPGKEQEHLGIIKHGAKLLFAYSEATVPKITINIRKAFGGGYIAMCSKGLGADIVIAWPSLEIAVMGPKGSDKIILNENRNDLDNDKDNAKDENKFKGLERGYIDEIINPRETRIAIIRALELVLSEKRSNFGKKHGNIPL